MIAAKVFRQRSLGLRAKANVLYALGQHTAAVDLHQQAAAWFEAVGQSHELARTLSGSIQPMLLLGEYNRAFAAAERARQIFSTEGNAWRLARLEINIGNIHYRQDRFVEARACYESAYRGLLNEKDAEGIAAAVRGVSPDSRSVRSPRARSARMASRADAFGVSATAKSFAVALFTETSVAWADSATATSRVKGLS